MDKKCLWTPYPKQVEALERTEFEILYGGARGGGKTDAGINWLIYDVANPDLRALIIRRNAKDLSDWIDRANKIYSLLGAKMVGSPPIYRWPSGAVFRTGHLDDERAYTNYQGHEYQRMLIEELTQIPSETLYLNLLASCRSTVRGLKPQIFLTTNPGEIGHAWVKKRFIDSTPPTVPYSFKTRVGKKEIELTRVFIPATMDDNPILMEVDPAYVARIEQLKETDYEKYMAWRFGDWDRFKGQVFHEFDRKKHVMKRVTPNEKLTHFLWTDWGYSEKSAFASYASALIQMKTEHGDVFNRVVTYQEWYANQKHPDEWARIIYKDARHRNFRKWIVDGSMLNPKTDGSISIAKIFQKEWRKLHKRNWISQTEPGSKNRIQRVAAVHNWLSMAPDGLPYWMITENCTELIRTLPQLVHDENKVEDVDTTQEDHAYDATSYGLGHVKFISAKPGSYGSKPMFKSKLAVSKPLIESIDLDAFKIKIKEQKDWRSV